MSVGSVTISIPELPPPTPPDGFTMSGYEVIFDGMGERTADAETIGKAATKLEGAFHGEFRVFADCRESVGSGEQTCEWNERKRCWGAWEWK